MTFQDKCKRVRWKMFFEGKWHKWHYLNEDKDGWFR